MIFTMPATGAPQSSEISNAEQELQVCFDLPDSKDLLRVVKEYPLLVQENQVLKNENENILEQLKLKDALLEIEGQRHEVEEERSAFYKQMIEDQGKLIDKYVEVNEKLQEQAERRGFWEKVGLVVTAIIGVAIGLSM